MIGYCSFGLGHGYWSSAMVIGYRLWLLVIDICTKKCGYGYNPFWLLAIVNYLRLLGIGCGLFTIRYFKF
jgi:hypothetical protein